MKFPIPCWFLAVLLLSSCSLLERSVDEPGSDRNAPPFDPSESAEVIDPETGDAIAPAKGLEAEVSRLNTKVAALETKLDVLTSNMERSQMQRSQPVIDAAPATPQPNMAAPVAEDPEEMEAVSAAPVRPSAPVRMSAPIEEPTVAPSAAEKEFRIAMELFQNGKNLDSAGRFALFAQKNPRHLLASHALYWAGEANARAQQWDTAILNWEDLEKKYPRSAYVPEALAGLSRAYDKQGNAGKSKLYRDTLTKAFPKSPVAISMQTGAEADASSSRMPNSRAQKEEIPVYDEESGAGGEE